MKSTHSRYHMMARISWIATLAIFVPLVVFLALSVSLHFFPVSWQLQLSVLLHHLPAAH